MSISSPDVPALDAVEHEQAYLTMLYGRLDAQREQATRRLTRLLAEPTGTPQARSERDTTVALYTAKLAETNAAEQGLCFGRLEFDGGDIRYIGRIGMFDEDGDYEPLLIDWRAPAARAFYLATAASPEGVRVRRHIRTRRRLVTDLDDEVLDLSQAHDTRPANVVAEAALMSALTATRTGRMRDIVATIQAEQDHVIRADLNGVLVVQGGPGTGKTAVALHRAAYLLYTYRQQLTTRGVLIVGPNPTFLRYISQVLPSLAETGVLLGTLGDLYPGVTARGVEPDATAEIKGRAVMTEVLVNAIADRQRVPDEPVEVVIDGDPLVLGPTTVAAVRERIRRSGRQHNLARPLFDTEIVHALSLELAERIGTDPYADDPLGGDDAPGDPQIMEEADLAEVRRELRAHPAVQRALDRLWPVLSPEQLLTDLFASEDRLATAAPQLTAAERTLLRREPGVSAWTPADVPLLDEAAELLGEDTSAAEALAERLRRARIAYAQGALDVVLGSRSIDVEDELDPEILAATDIIDASLLAERHDELERLTAAERAAADRTWAFGHVIVDEAQELSAMAWRLLMRRCPARSMTVVGDVAQTSDPAGTASWRPVFEPWVANRWRLAELTVNYRTPAEIMEVAAGVLTDIDPEASPPRSVRDTGVRPWCRRVAPADLAAEVVSLVRAHLGVADGGNLGVLVPAGLLGEVGAAVSAGAPDAAVNADPELESRAVVLTVRQAKGLEFDTVVVVEPAGIVAESPRGARDLYVALTRATQRLGILHTGDLPPALAGAAWRGSPE